MKIVWKHVDIYDAGSINRNVTIIQNTLNIRQNLLYHRTSYSEPISASFAFLRFIVLIFFFKFIYAQYTFVCKIKFVFKCTYNLQSVKISYKNIKKLKGYNSRDTIYRVLCTGGGLIFQ